MSEKLQKLDGLVLIMLRSTSLLARIHLGMDFYFFFFLKKEFFSLIADASVGDVFKQDGKWYEVEKVLGNVKKGKEKAQPKVQIKDILSGARKEVRCKSEKIDVTGNLKK